MFGSKVLNSVFIFFIKVYQVTLGSFLTGGNCRFYPSCSHYAEEALKTHNSFYALFLIGKRLSKCYPWGPQGYDPVPQKLLK